MVRNKEEENLFQKDTKNDDFVVSAFWISQFLHCFPQNKAEQLYAMTSSSKLIGNTRWPLDLTWGELGVGMGVLHIFCYSALLPTGFTRTRSVITAPSSGTSMLSLFTLLLTQTVVHLDHSFNILKTIITFMWCIYLPVVIKWSKEETSKTSALLKKIMAWFIIHFLHLFGHKQLF